MNLGAIYYVLVNGGGTRVRGWGHAIGLSDAESGRRKIKKAGDGVKRRRLKDRI